MSATGSANQGLSLLFALGHPAPNGQIKWETLLFAAFPKLILLTHYTRKAITPSTG